MSPLPLDVLTWQATIASEDGPRDYTMRLTLLALSAVMLRSNVSRLRATAKDIAAATGLSRQWAMHTVLKATKQGWVIRSNPRGQGKAWRCSEYAPSLPIGDLNHVVERGTSALAEARA